MATGSLSASATQIAMGEALTLTVSVTDSGSSAITLTSDSDPGDSSGWKNIALDSNGAATVSVTPTVAGSFTFTLNADGAAIQDASGNPITAGPVQVAAHTTTAAPHSTTTAAAHSTTAAPHSTTTAAAHSTTAVPHSTTTAAAHSTTAAPHSTTTAAAHSTTAAPHSTTTAAAHSTTAAPHSTTTAAAHSTTAAPHSTTTAAAHSTTAAPHSTTTAAAHSTTAAPHSTTTAAAHSTTAAPHSTTTAAAHSTTAAPHSTTTAAAHSTTAAPHSTTTAAAGHSTTAAPGHSTTATPGGSTTAAAGAPGFKPDSIKITVDPDDGTQQNPSSYQVSTDATLTLSWEAVGAKSVHIDPLGDQDVSGSTSIPAKDATYTLTAVSDSGTSSTPFTLEVHTHAPGSVVSPHVSVNSGIGKILSLNAMVDGAAVTSVAQGKPYKVTLVCSDGTDSATINGDSIDLAAGDPGTKTGSLEIASADVQQNSFDCQVSAGGQVADSQTLSVAILPTSTSAPHSTTTHAGSTTTHHPGSSTTHAGSTTTHHPGSSTTHAGSTTTHHPGSSTTHAGSTTTHHPGSSTTHAGSTTTHHPGSSTTIHPGSTTTHHPGSSTTIHPGSTTTHHPGSSTTHAGSTTTHHPGSSTTAHPGSTTSHHPGSTTTASGTAPVPTITADASGTVPLKTAIGINWDIKNFVAGMTVSLSCDADPGDAGFTFAGMDMTKQCDANGGGAQTVTPTNEGTFNFKITVTPAGGTAVDSALFTIIIKAGHVFAPKQGLQLKPGEEPQLRYFSAYPKGSQLLSTATSIHAPRDGQVVLSWEVAGEIASIAIDNDVGEVVDKTNEDKDGDKNGDGEVEAKFSPGTDGQIKYTLTMTPTNANWDKKTQTVTVGLPGTVPDHQDATVPFKLDFSVSPAKVARGGNVVLQWRVIGDADKISIVDVQDSVALTGPATINTGKNPPQPDGNYIMRAYKNGAQLGEAKAMVELDDDVTAGDKLYFKPGQATPLDYDGSVLDMIPVLGAKLKSIFSAKIGYFELQGDLKFKLHGTFTPVGTALPQPNSKPVYLGIVTQVANKLGLDNLGFKGARLEGSALPFVKSGTSTNYWVDLSGAIVADFGMTVFAKLELDGAKVKPAVLKGKFAVEGPGLSAAVGGTIPFNGDITTEVMSGNINCTIELTSEVGLVPNWPKILGDILKEYLEKVLEDMGVELFGEAFGDACVAAIGDLAGAIAPFAVAGVIIYAFWKLQQQMAEQAALCNGTAEQTAVQTWINGFKDSLMLDKYNTPKSTDDLYGDGWDKGGSLGAKYLGQFVKSDGVQTWKKQMQQQYPDYASDQSWIDDKILEGFHNEMQKQMDNIVAKATAAVQPSIHLQLFNAWCDKHDNNLVDCLPVFVNMWPKHGTVDDYKWLPPEVYTRADKNGWLKDGFVGYTPPADPPMLHLMTQAQAKVVTEYCTDFVILKNIANADIGKELLGAGLDWKEGDDLGKKLAPTKTDYILPLTKQADVNLINAIGANVTQIRVPAYLIGGRAFTRCTDGWLEIKVNA